MDDRERDEILWRLDERTEGIQTDIHDLKEVSAEQDRKIQRNHQVARDNRKILNVMTFGIGTVVSAFIGQLAGILRF